MELEHSIERRDFVVWAESLQWIGIKRSYLPGESLDKMVIAKLENKLYLCLHLPKPYAMGKRPLLRPREGLLKA